jgi:hypothetical protein
MILENHQDFQRELQIEYRAARELFGEEPLTGSLSIFASFRSGGAKGRRKEIFDSFPLILRPKQA